MATLRFTQVGLPPVTPPFRFAGAWAITSDDPRLQGLSGLAWDGRQLASVSDMGFAWRFAPPLPRPATWGAVADLRDGPGPFGRKVNRDAEALMRDGSGHGWWVAFEQIHSIWHYDDRFQHADRSISLAASGWSDNRGAEGLARSGSTMLAFGERGRDLIAIDGRLRRIPLASDWMVADAATASDGTVWLLLRHHYGVDAALAPLRPSRSGWVVGTHVPVPKALFDNLEGLAIEPKGKIDRFWIVSDDGHRLFARTLLIALDLPRTQENARR